MLKISRDDVEALMQACSRAETRESLLKAMPAIIKKIGGGGYSYHYIPHLAADDYTADKVIHVSDPNSEWAQYYMRHYKYVRDPVQIFAFQSGRAIWTQDLLKEREFQEPESQNYLRKAIGSIGDGMVVPVFGPHRSRSVLFLQIPGQRVAPEPIQMFLLEQMSFYFHRRYCELTPRPLRGVSLTPRERQVLQYLPLGQSNKEIARTLGISQSTVNDYVRSLLLKLDASDRLTASLKAFTLDLIE